STTLRPLGPSVTFTAFATAFAPRSSARRASSSNLSCFAAIISSYFRFLIFDFRFWPIQIENRKSKIENHLLLDRIHLILIENDVIFSVEGDLGSPVFGVDDRVPGLDGQRNDLAVVQRAAFADGDDAPFLRLFASGIGQDDAARGLLLFLSGQHHDLGGQRSQ